MRTSILIRVSKIKGRYAARSVLTDRSRAFPATAADILGPELAKAVADVAVKLYSTASKHAASRGIILADTKFEFGLVKSSEAHLAPTASLAGAKMPSGESLDDTTLILVDEVLTPDSSRFWDAKDYEVGRGQASWDKQYVRDWLKANGKDKAADTGEKVTLPDEVVLGTSKRYQEAYEKITGKVWSV